jgi:hypothetical protein
MTARPCATDHADPRPDTCPLCWRAVHCREWQELWGLPTTAPTCYDGAGALASLAAAPAPASAPPGRGPGTELRKVLERFGIPEPAGCACATRAAQMDAWGVEGCRRHRAEIVAWLRDEWAKLARRTRRRAAVRALRAGFVHPFDPAGALVDRAIRQAERLAQDRGADHVN